MKKIHLYYVYILTNRNNNVLYTGVTNDLIRRCIEHRMKNTSGFTRKYNIYKLVFYEIYDYIELAIEREKQIKRLSRLRKNNLINGFNPHWTDLFYCGKILKTPL